VPFAISSFGKPTVPGGPSFNIGHSGNEILVAFADRGRVGVDVEAVRPLDDLHGLARASFVPAEVEVLPGESKHTWLGITIHEGKHRQIHRMLEALGHRIAKLQRVAFGPITFHDLRVGDARELTQSEVNELRRAVGLPATR